MCVWDPRYILGFSDELAVGERRRLSGGSKAFDMTKEWRYEENCGTCTLETPFVR